MEKDLDKYYKEQEEAVKNRFKGMTGAEKLKLAEKLYWDARALKKAYLRQQHPDWSEEELEAEVKFIFMTSRTY